MQRQTEPKDAQDAPAEHDVPTVRRVRRSGEGMASLLAHLRDQEAQRQTAQQPEPADGSSDSRNG